MNVAIAGVLALMLGVLQYLLKVMKKIINKVEYDKEEEHQLFLIFINRLPNCYENNTVSKTEMSQYMIKLKKYLLKINTGKILWYSNEINKTIQISVSA